MLTMSTLDVENYDQYFKSIIITAEAKHSAF